MPKSTIEWIAIILLIVGGLNWGLVAAFQLDLVAAVFGSIPVLQRIVYGLVGIAAIYQIYRLVSK